MDSRTSRTLVKPLASPNGTFTVKLRVSLKVPFISFRLREGAASMTSYVTVQRHRHTTGPAINSHHWRNAGTWQSREPDKWQKQSKAWKGALRLRYTSILTPFIIYSLFCFVLNTFLLFARNFIQAQLKVPLC